MKFITRNLKKCWRTYLPDDTKSNNRRPIKRKSKENLEKEIIRFYIEKQKIENRENITLEELYTEWLLYKRDYTSVKAKTIQEYVSEWNRFFQRHGSFQNEDRRNQTHYPYPVFSEKPQKNVSIPTRESATPVLS